MRRPATHQIVAARRKVTVAEYAEHWLATTAAPPFIARYASENRRRFLKAYVLPHIGHVRIDRVSPRRATELQLELFKQGLSSGTVIHALVSVAGSMWRDAQRDGLTRQLPFRGMRWPRPDRKKPDPFTEDEEQRIVRFFADYAGGSYVLWVSLLFGTGARPSEIAGLRWEDIDLDAGTASIRRALVAREETRGKTWRAMRTIALAPHLVELLATQSRGASWVCLEARGGPISSTTWSGNKWPQALKRLGIRYRKFYAARHTYISRALSLGAPPIQVAEYCGTSLSKVSQVYAAWIGDHREDPLTAARRRLSGR